MAALRKIVQQKSQVDALDIERALTQRYTQQLAHQETRLDFLSRAAAGLQAKSDQAQKGLDDLIQNLDLDTTI